MIHHTFNNSLLLSSISNIHSIFRVELALQPNSVTWLSDILYLISCHVEDVAACLSGYVASIQNSC